MKKTVKVKYQYINVVEPINIVPRVIKQSKSTLTLSKIGENSIMTLPSILKERDSAILHR